MLLDVPGLHFYASNRLEILAENLASVVRNPLGSPLTPETVAFYQAAMRTIRDAGARFLVGGAYAFGPYTGGASVPDSLPVVAR